MKVGLISDTHSHIDEKIVKHLKGCDEIWHAGDIGDLKVTDELDKIILHRFILQPVKIHSRGAKNAPILLFVDGQLCRLCVSNDGTLLNSKLK